MQIPDKESHVRENPAGKPFDNAYGVESCKAGTGNANMTVVHICRISDALRRADNRAEARRDVDKPIL